MGNYNINIASASNVLFGVALLLIVLSHFIEHQLLTFSLLRIGVFCALLSAFYAIYRFDFEGMTLKAIWSSLNEKQSKSLTTKESIWLFQPIIFGISGVVLALYSNPWL